MSVQQFITKHMDDNRSEYERIAKQIWDTPELRFEEEQSSKTLADYIESQGFNVDRGIANIDTAFRASYGSGAPVIAFLGEFDALSDLSQVENETSYSPKIQGGNGHGCGHHMLGTAALAAAIAARDYMVENNLPGTIEFYGCPGEEGGSGKTFMAREGVFDNIDTAITWHPGTFNTVWAFETLANYQVSFKFKGKASHAAASPHLGRSALDAVELMNIGSNYLREHIEETSRLHYAITNTGGISPNVVQPEAEVLYLMRGTTVQKAKNVFERVQKIAEGAALMTETELDVRFDKACTNYVRNHTLEEVMNNEMAAFDEPKFTDEEKALAKKFYDTLSESEQQSAVEEVRKVSSESLPTDLPELAIPSTPGEKRLAGSTDVGDVSAIAPTVQCYTTCYAFGTPMHTWQMVAQGKTSYAMTGMLYAAKLMSGTAAQLLHHPEKIAMAKEELNEHLGGKPYECPIPEGITPTKISH
ncbi:amidohydrolase [Geomicrobium sediminis]|uniref:Aminobenzoyl-glutamate utilization protein B n=1 Tax=Geomicrobium sediminis TaxID=1347788 RepID=A0ABS2PCQ3_9BACL|nr:amidohydrolase [Geomicrobium sediminis]MBM7632830.1 aminobenzoyl-glutamate utilization protein B [Geomicrobium sediminis]